MKMFVMPEWLKWVLSLFILSLIPLAWLHESQAAHSTVSSVPTNICGADNLTYTRLDSSDVYTLVRDDWDHAGLKCISFKK